VKEQIDRAKDGTGIVYYMAPRLGSDVRVPKLSYMIAFEHWHWVIGTGVYVDDINARFAEVARQFFAIAIAPRPGHGDLWLSLVTPDHPPARAHDGRAEGAGGG
jgi:hypothetical protein